jgi:hypothetical protein
VGQSQQTTKGQSNSDAGRFQRAVDAPKAAQELVIVEMLGQGEIAA